MAEGKVINVNLTDLPIHQLHELKLNVEKELEFYKDAVLSLKEVQVKMQESGNCVNNLIPHIDQEVLVPVTASMYVVGEIEDKQNVLIDIGTGYYVQKSWDDAKDYFKRKVEYVTSQIEKVQNVGKEKAAIREAVVSVLQTKQKASQPGPSTSKK